MSQIVTSTSTENEHEKVRPWTTDDYVQFMTLVHNNEAQRLLEISSAVSLERIRESAGSENIDEVDNIRHCEELCVHFFKK